jgi:hypothetical protein
VLLDITNHITQALPSMVSRALIVHIANCSFNRICRGTIGRQPQQCKAGMAFDPLPHGLGFMNTVVIHDHIDVGKPWSWVGVIQECQQVPEERGRLPHAVAMENLAGGEIQGASKIMLRVLAGCYDLQLAPFGHPGRADLGQQVDVGLIGKHQYVVRLHCSA